MTKHLMNHRFLGAVFIGLLVLAIWLVAGAFGQKFTSFDTVTATSSNVGLQLPARADVKVRGVIVGQVTKVTSAGEGATMKLGIDPDKIGEIPKNVTASILPKTLFGEKYVDLTIPSDPSSTPLRAGDSIGRTKLPTEVEAVLNDLYPLLRAVQPAELNYTLNALADALEGRGAKIGDTIVTLDSYLKRMNPQVPALIQDIKLLASVTGTYADVTPELAATLRNLTKTGNTLREKEGTLNSFLKDLTAFSDTTTAFLDDNGNNIIRLGQLSEPIVALLAKYSPEYPCLLEGIVKQAPRLGNTFRDFIFHINLKLLPRQPRAYTSGDRPVYGATNGPNCAGLPSPPIPFYPRGGQFPNINDGANGLGKGDNQRAATGFGVRGGSATSASSASSASSTASQGLSVGTTGTEAQKALVNSLLAPSLGVPADQVSDMASLLYGPAMAGTEVSVR